MSQVTSAVLRAEAARCADMAKSSNIPYIRRSLGKMAELYQAHAVWLEAEIAAGRLSREVEVPTEPPKGTG